MHANLDFLLICFCFALNHTAFSICNSFDLFFLSLFCITAATNVHWNCYQVNYGYQRSNPPRELGILRRSRFLFRFLSSESSFFHILFGNFNPLLCFIERYFFRPSYFLQTSIASSGQLSNPVANSSKPFFEFSSLRSDYSSHLAGCISLLVFEENDAIFYPTATNPFCERCSLVANIPKINCTLLDAYFYLLRENGIFRAATRVITVTKSGQYFFAHIRRR